MVIFKSVLSLLFFVYYLKINVYNACDDVRFKKINQIAKIIRDGINIKLFNSILAELSDLAL